MKIKVKVSESSCLSKKERPDKNIIYINWTSCALLECIVPACKEPKCVLFLLNYKKELKQNQINLQHWQGREWHIIDKIERWWREISNKINNKDQDLVNQWKRSTPHHRQMSTVCVTVTPTVIGSLYCSTVLCTLYSCMNKMNQRTDYWH